MFPSTRDPLLPPRRTFGAALLDAADLLVAFVTLESYGLADLRHAGASRPLAPEPPAAAPADLGFERPAAGRLATGSLASDPHRAGQSRHRIGPVASRRRRAGSVATREQLCLTPVPDRTAPVTDPRCISSQSTTSHDLQQ